MSARARLPQRPKRRKIPLSVKVIACERRLCELLGTDRIEYNHNPALIYREIRADGKDYIPAQNDPNCIEALSREEHAKDTNGTPATTLGSVKHGAAKIDRLRGKTKQGPKRQIPNAGFPKPPEGYKYRWGKRPMGKRKGAA
ncbi:hypothetical protein [Pelagibius sp.]|uniref:hypothetical protein n=1 Tax=Pelagibius sp. TaxID=1931238 RepID=UPI003BB1B8B1